METVIVVATIRAKAGLQEQAYQLLQGLLAPTHKEPGCLFYALHRRSDDPRTFVFVEKWRSGADLQAHLVSPHITSTMARKDEFIEHLDIAALEALPGGNREKSVL